MVENKDFILKGIVFVIHKFTDLYFPLIPQHFDLTLFISS